MADQQKAEEIRQQMLEHIQRMVQYWAEQPGLNIHDRCDGVAFSILTMIDGAADVPPMAMVAFTESGDPIDVNEGCELHEAYASLARSSRGASS